MENKEFAERIKNANTFLTKLKANNNRDWFSDHKSEYDVHVKQTGQILLDEFCQVLEPMIGSAPSTKMFRINRDIRFSKDKTPYNSHLHLMWSDGSETGFFFGASPEYVTAGCGVMVLKKEKLDAYRALVVKDGDALANIIAALLEKSFRLDAPQLKRVPAPYDKEHPHAEHLRRKSLALWYDFDPSDLSFDKVVETFEAFLPLHKFCQKIG